MPLTACMLYAATFSISSQHSDHMYLETNIFDALPFFRMYRTVTPIYIVHASAPSRRYGRPDCPADSGDLSNASLFLRF